MITQRTKFTTLSTTLAAIALLGCGTGFAAQTTGNATGSATATAPVTAAPAPAAKSTTTTAQPGSSTASPVKKVTWKECKKEATDKGLKGKARTQFVKDCHSGKGDMGAKASS